MAMMAVLALDRVEAQGLPANPGVAGPADLAANRAMAAAGDPNARLAFELETEFLVGTSEVAAGRCDLAIRRFEQILDRNPDLPRVRLELAACQFSLGQDFSAARNFRIVYHSDVPTQVRLNVRAFLNAIERRRVFVPAIGLGIAPTTNVNAATAARSVSILGLEFDLPPEARQQSGVGLATLIGGEWRVPVTDNARLIAGGLWQQRWYRDSTYNDRILGASLGVGYTDANYDVSLRFIPTERSIGGNTVQQQYALYLDMAQTVTTDLALAGIGQIGRVTYAEPNTPLDGYNAQLLLGVRYNLGGLTQLQFLAGPVAQTAEDSFNDLRGWRVLAFLATDVIPSLEVALLASAGIIRSRAENPLFEVHRTDRDLELRGDVTLRSINYFGLSPSIGATYAVRNSNIDVYSINVLEFRVGVRTAY